MIYLPLDALHWIETHIVLQEINYVYVKDNGPPIKSAALVRRMLRPETS